MPSLGPRIGMRDMKRIEEAIRDKFVQGLCPPPPPETGIGKPSSRDFTIGPGDPFRKALDPGKKNLRMENGAFGQKLSFRGSKITLDPMIP